MNERLFSIATKVATPVSLASLCVIALYLIYQGILGLHVFGNLTGDQTNSLLNTIADKIFYLAIVMSVVSVPSYLYTKRLTALSGRQPVPKTIFGNVLNERGAPVSKAIVFVEGIDRRKETDENGWFQIQVEDRASFTVRASFGGTVATADVRRSRLHEPVRLILLSHSALVASDVQAKLDLTGPLKSAQKQQPKVLYCSFCGHSQHEVRKLIAGPTALICDECSDLCESIIEVESKDSIKQITQINELCETTLQLANHALAIEDRTRLQDRADELATNLRSRRRERPGDTLAGSMLTRVVGNGNFGAVWEAQELKEGTSGITGRKVAVKVFDQNKLAQGLMLWRFLRGIRAMQHLSAQGKLVPKSIIRILSTEDRSLAFAMEYLPGGDLERIRQYGWSLDKKMAIFRQVTEAVDFAHHCGIVHRDIKPANIVLDAENNAVLTDFDIADLNFARTQSVMSGSLGTPQFAAPEQLTGETLQAFPTADVFSLGKLLYFLITEKAPPIGSGEPGRIPTYLEAVGDENLRIVIHRASSYRPADRFQTVSEMVQAMGSPVAQGALTSPAAETSPLP